MTKSHRAAAGGLFACGLITAAALATLALAQDSGRQIRVKRPSGVSADAIIVDPNVTEYRASAAPLTTESTIDLDAVVVSDLILCSGYNQVSISGTTSTPGTLVKLAAYIYYRAPTGILTLRHQVTQTLTTESLNTTNTGRFLTEQPLDVNTRGGTHMLVKVVEIQNGNWQFKPAGVH